MSGAKRILVAGFGKSDWLGLVPVGQRSVQSIPQGLLALVPEPADGIEIHKDGPDPIRDTVPLMRKLIKRQLWQGKKLAAKLKGSFIQDTARNFYDFIFKYIQYKPDGEDEVIKSLRKLIYSGEGDCDCFTTALSNLLLNTKIPHFLRVAGYDGNKFSHIYIVIPKNKSMETDRNGNMSATDYITLDCVPHKFNHEVPFTSHKDFPMRLISLDGFADNRDYGYSTRLGCAPLKPGAAIPRPKPKVFVSEIQLYNSGIADMKSELKKQGIAVTEAGNALHVVTPTGVKELPRFVDQAKAAEVTKAVVKEVTAPVTTASPVTQTNNAPVTTTSETKPVMAGMGKVAGWGLGILVGGAILKSIFSSKKEDKAAAGLSGVKPRKSMKRLSIK